jgi:hypothetical protein
LKQKIHRISPSSFLRYERALRVLRKDLVIERERERTIRDDFVCFQTRDSSF